MSTATEALGERLFGATAEQPSAATGTVLRAGRMREYAEAAGLTCEVVPIENDFFRFYALRRAAPAEPERSRRT